MSKTDKAYIILEAQEGNKLDVHIACDENPTLQMAVHAAAELIARFAPGDDPLICQMANKLAQQYDERQKQNNNKENEKWNQ